MSPNTELGKELAHVSQYESVPVHSCFIALVCARYCPKCYKCISSFKPHGSPFRGRCTTVAPILQVRKLSTESLSNLSKVTQLVNGRVGMGTQAAQVQSFTLSS